MSKDTVAIDGEQLQLVLNTISETVGPHGWEIAGTLATLVIALTAIIAAGYAKHQIDAAKQTIHGAEQAAREQLKSAGQLLREIKNANEESAKFARANFLLQLNNVFQSETIIQARAEFKALRDMLEKEIKERQDYDKKTGKEIEDLRKQYFSDHLYKLRNHENDGEKKKYIGLLNLCGFYETAAVLIENKCIGLDELVNLYGGAVVELHEWMEKHIEIEKEKYEKRGKPGYFANFSELAHTVGPRLVELEAKRKNR